MKTGMMFSNKGTRMDKKNKPPYPVGNNGAVDAAYNTMTPLS